MRTRLSPRTGPTVIRFLLRSIRIAQNGNSRSGWLQQIVNTD
jgi:hypothetical protein